MTKVLPVIHHLNYSTTIEQAWLAHQCGAHGVFLIAHDGDDTALLAPARALRKVYPTWYLGMNLLSTNNLKAIEIAAGEGMDAIWMDNAGITSAGVSAYGQAITEKLNTTKLDSFAGVAFKYQEHEANPAAAASIAVSMGHIPTTSGTRTGSAPTLEKIISMHNVLNGGSMAIASGLTPDNVTHYKPYTSHMLVATGVASDSYHLDKTKLERFLHLAK